MACSSSVDGVVFGVDMVGDSANVTERRGGLTHGGSGGVGTEADVGDSLLPPSAMTSRLLQRLTIPEYDKCCESDLFLRCQSNSLVRNTAMRNK